MKIILNTFLLFLISVSVFGIQLPDTDSIVPPPPSPTLITGPDICCQNDTCTYSADLPIDCSAQWFADDVLQGSGSAVLEIVWETSGEHELRLNAFCDTVSNPLDTIIVLVNDVAGLPEIIVGETEPCLNTEEIYTTIVTDGETCQWKINEIIQTDTTDFIEIFWDEVGNHLLEVRAVNQCGISDAQSLVVKVFEMPLVNLGNDTTIYEGQTLILDAGNAGSNFLWNTEATTQSIEVSASDIYWVDVNNTCGLDSDTIIVDVIVGIISDETQIKPIISFSDEILKIEISGERIELLQAYNLQGKLLSEVEDQNSIKINQKGVCILLIQTSKQQLSTKILIK